MKFHHVKPHKNVCDPLSFWCTTWQPLMVFSVCMTRSTCHPLPSEKIVSTLTYYQVITVLGYIINIFLIWTYLFLLWVVFLSVWRRRNNKWVIFVANTIIVSFESYHLIYYFINYVQTFSINFWILFYPSSFLSIVNISVHYTITNLKHLVHLKIIW